MQIFRRLAFLSLMLFAAFAGLRAQNYAWPKNYEGVMLQGFYWDSYSDTKWSNLEANADELSTYFKLIWVPNGAKASTNPSMGYDPVYWFSNYYSSFGTESQLRSMIQTFKAKGTGIIADVVINHRSGVSNWTNFPAETWNGQTWQLGPEHICCDDEVASASGQAKPTGAYDTGEGFNGARDLDHTNATVQNNCKNYCKFLLDDMGFVGFRYDMAKGYGGQYNKIYNLYSKPTYSVGEYWDGSYDALAAWIEATGRQSAAFDFAFKYALNDAFSSGDMSKLVWKANGTTPQPAGLIHFGYPDYAVTFIDNHDTYRDSNKFTGNVAAAHAFMLCSPGTPCVFLPHWKEYKSQIKKLIKIRNAVGVNNMSAVNVLQTSSSVYLAEVTGSKGKLVVKVGPAMVSPQGYTDADIKASGDNYCVWTKVNIDSTDDPDDPDDPSTYPSMLYLVGNVEGQTWSTTDAPAADTAADGVYTWNNLTIDNAGAGYGYFSLITARGADWDADVNSSDRYGASSKDELITSTSTIVCYQANISASSACSWKAAAGEYKVVANLKTSTLTITSTGEGGGGEIVTPTPTPTGLTIYFDNSSANWSTVNVYMYGAAGDVDATGKWPGKEMTKFEGDMWKITFEGLTNYEGYNVIFNNGNGAQTADDVAAVDRGIYNTTGMIGISGITAVESADESDAPVEYYNLQGIRVENPGHGLYIRRQGSRTAKVRL